MPYRRLPATDVGRLRALKTVLDDDSIYTVGNRVVEWKTLSAAQAAYNRFAEAVEQLQLARRSELKPDRRYGELLRRARLFVNHFLQVLLLAAERGEVPRAALALYGLQPDASALPDLNTERKVLEWGRRAIEGERLRLQRGGVPIYNPNVAKVAVHYDLFREAYDRRQASLEQSAEQRARVAELRKGVDEVLRTLWDEIERAHAALPPAERYAACRRYGVVYYYRRHEPHEL